MSNKNIFKIIDVNSMFEKKKDKKQDFKKNNINHNFYKNNCNCLKPVVEKIVEPLPFVIMKGAFSFYKTIHL